MSNLGEGIREAAFKDGEARGEARGKAIGEASGVEKMVVSLLKADQTVDFVAKVAKMTVEQVRAIGKKAAVL